MTEFRRKVRQAGSRYRVVKNTLALRAVEGHAPRDAGRRVRRAPTGVAYTGTDPVALAKVLIDFAKDHPRWCVKGGLVSGSQMLDAEGVKALSTMPSLPELRAKLLGLLQAPGQPAGAPAQHPGQPARPGAEGAPGEGRKARPSACPPERFQPQRLRSRREEEDRQMADIQAIANDLSGLTVMQVAELVKMLEEKWGVSAAAAAPVMMAAAGAPRRRGGGPGRGEDRVRGAPHRAPATRRST